MILTEYVCEINTASNSNEIVFLISPEKKNISKLLNFYIKYNSLLQIIINASENTRIIYI